MLLVFLCNSKFRSVDSVFVRSSEISMFRKSLNIYAITQFILENELKSYHGKEKSVKTAVHRKFYRPLNPYSGCRQDQQSGFLQSFRYLALKVSSIF